MTQREETDRDTDRQTERQTVERKRETDRQTETEIYSESMRVTQREDTDRDIVTEKERRYNTSKHKHAIALQILSWPDVALGRLKTELGLVSSQHRPVRSRTRQAEDRAWSGILTAPTCQE